MRLAVGPAPRHYTGPPGGSAAGAHGFLVLGQLFGSGGSFRHRGPSIANTQRVSSDIATLQSTPSTATASQLRQRDSTAANTKHREHTVQELADSSGSASLEEELGCEPSQADSDTDNRHKAADGAP